MKKTIIALMALASSAFAADYSVADSPTWTATFGSEYDSGYTTTLASPGTFWDAGDIKVEGGVLTKNNKRIHMAGGTYGNWAEDFEFSLDISLPGLVDGHITEIKASSSGTWLCIGLNTKGALTLTGAASGTSAEGVVTTDTPITLTFTKCGAEAFVGVNGTTVLTTSISDSLTGIINNIALGGNTGSDKRVPTFISDLSWSAVTPVTTPETPAVPEPTTATLSLLALAGLAARRRRK